MFNHAFAVGQRVYFVDDNRQGVVTEVRDSWADEYTVEMDDGEIRNFAEFQLEAVEVEADPE